MSGLTHEEFQTAARVVAGNPTPEELAAALAVLEIALEQEQEAGSAGVRQLRSTWAKNGSMLRGEILPGRGQWQAAVRSGLK
jgi:hypothetical protein